MVIPEEEREKGIKDVFNEIMAETFPNQSPEEIDIQEQGTQRVSNKINPNRPMARHIILKMAKIEGKEYTLNAAREMQRVIFKRVSITLSADFSTEI